MKKIPKLALIPATIGTKLFSVLPSDGSGDFDFTRASAATRINEDGFIETVASGDSRLDYPLIDGVVSGCPSVLLEPQRTNLIPYSEDFNGSGWLISDITVTANQIISPDGTLNASKLEMIGNGSLRNQSEASFSNGYAYSIFVKKGNSRYVTIRSTFFTQSIVVGFDLDTLTAQTNGKIEDYGNDWYRLSITKDISGDVDRSGFFYLYLTNSLGSQISVSGNYNYFYGGQIEDGSYPTSYIPTNGTTVTRLADTANGAGDATTFNDSEGVLMAEIGFVDDTSFKAISISSGAIANSIRMYSSLVDNQLVFRVRVNDVDQVLKLITLSNTSISNKISIKYKENDFSIFVNGFKLETDTSGITYPAETLNQLNFNRSDGSDPFYGNTKQIQYYNTALTDSELEELTSWTSFTAMAQGQTYSIK